MFDSLKDKLQDVFSGLGKRGALREADVNAALREVRLALLDADVALPVVKSFMSRVREQAVGVEVLKAVRPDQQVIKIVNDVLVEVLGGDAAPLNVAVNPPAVILMAGLQGSGKTTTAGKLALRLRSKERKKVIRLRTCSTIVVFCSNDWSSLACVRICEIWSAPLLPLLLVILCGWWCAYFSGIGVFLDCLFFVSLHLL